MFSDFGYFSLDKARLISEQERAFSKHPIIFKRQEAGTGKDQAEEGASSHRLGSSQVPTSTGSGLLASQSVDTSSQPQTLDSLQASQAASPSNSQEFDDVFNHGFFE